MNNDIAAPQATEPNNNENNSESSINEEER